MTAWRLGVLCALLVCIALSLVLVRTAQTGAASRMLRAQYAMIQLRRELWHVQASVARLRSPIKLHQRLEWFDTGLVPPEPAGVSSIPDRRFVIYNETIASTNH